MSIRILLVSQSIGAEAKRQKELTEFDYGVLVTKHLYNSQTQIDQTLLAPFDILIFSDRLMEEAAWKMSKQADLVKRMPKLMLTHHSLTPEYQQLCESHKIDHCLSANILTVELVSAIESAFQVHNAFPDQGSHLHRNLSNTKPVDDMPILLSKIESSIYAALRENVNQPLSVEELYQKIWGKEYSEEKKGLVSFNIRKLRQRLGDNLKNPEFIVNIRGKGYMMTKECSKKEILS